MAVAGLIFAVAGFMAASKIIDQMGGDPEGEVAGEAAKYQALTALQQQMPLNRMRQRLSTQEESQGALESELGSIGSGMREVGLGRRVTGARDLLDAVSQRLGTTSEDLGRRLSPTNVGDYSSVSRAAFGRSAKRMK
jgi:hypothetical protein